MQLALMVDATQSGAGPWYCGGDSLASSGKKSVQIGGFASSAVWSAQVKIWGANDQRFPMLIGTFHVDNAANAEAAEINFKWEFFRSELVEVTGTDTKVSAIMSV